MKKRFITAVAVSGLAILGMADSASAFTLTYDCTQAGGCASAAEGGASAVSGTAEFTFAAYDSGSALYSLPNDTTVVMAVKLTNTSGFVSRISGFALNFPKPPATPDENHYDAGTTPFTEVHFGSGFNGGGAWGASFDICANDGNSCPGGGGSGINDGAFASLYFGFTESLTAAEVQTAFLTLFEKECQSAMRFQGFSSNGATSDKVCGGLDSGSSSSSSSSGGEGSTSSSSGTTVPEPSSSLALLGLGLIGLGFARRMRSAA